MVMKMVVPGAPGWAARELAPPDLSQSARLTLEQWAAATDKDTSVAWGCVGADAGSWSRDATEVAQQKLAELASSTSARMRGEATPMHVTASAQDGRVRSLFADNQAAASQARTFVTFTEGRVHGCFVACVGNGCDDVVVSSSVTGDLRDPPPPGLALGSVGFVIHHPHAALGIFSTALVLASVVAVVTRPRRLRAREPRR